MAESRKTKAELEREIIFLRARVNEKKALINGSAGVQCRIAKIEAKALQRLLERLTEQFHSAPDK